MKQHITAPQLKKLASWTGKPIFACGYCELQDLLRGIMMPIYYNSGVYGWNYDVYSFDSCYIVTGYRFPATIGKTLSHSVCKALEEKANANYEVYAKAPYKYLDVYKIHSLQRGFVNGLLRGLATDGDVTH